MSRFKITTTREEYDEIRGFCCYRGEYGDITTAKTLESGDIEFVIKTENKKGLENKLEDITPFLSRKLEVYKLIYRCDPLEFIVSVDPSWLRNITNQDTEQMCWEEMYNPLESSYLSTFTLDCVKETIEDRDMEYCETHLKMFENQLKKLTNKEDVSNVRCILNLQ